MYTLTRLIQEGAIYLENIQDGFNNYDSQVVTLNQEEAYDTIKILWQINGSENTYADFYYYTLDEQARAKVDAVLDEKEREYLKSLICSPEVIIFLLDDTLLKILIKLNYLEMLFSTFYFTKDPCTMWGNYNHEYVIFKNRP